MFYKVKGKPRMDVYFELELTQTFQHKLLYIFKVIQLFLMLN